MINPFYRAKHWYRRFSAAHECPVCGWFGGKFDSDDWHPETICPKCNSQVRHRLLVATLSQQGRFNFKTLFEGKKVLHFAPEIELRRLIEPLSATYTTSDFLIPGHDLALDMSNMHEIDDGSYDVVIACDVLEHVPDDELALQEVKRVLAPQGVAILTVPEASGLEHKFELPLDASPEERLEKCGQDDHQRIYGKEDFIHYLDKTGFETTVMDHNNFNTKQVARQCLYPPVLSDHPLATNHRHIYFVNNANK